jgi:hypothetical protein
MIETIYGKVLTQEHHDFLIQLRDSGVTNMWGATPYIQREFGLNRDEANDILLEWIDYMTSREQ